MHPWDFEARGTQRAISLFPMAGGPARVNRSPYGRHTSYKAAAAITATHQVYRSLRESSNRAPLEKARRCQDRIGAGTKKAAPKKERGHRRV